MMKHTPEPWVIDTDGDGKPFAIVTSTHDKNGLDDDVCEVYGGNDDDDGVREANARLIASAPEMLKALKEFSDYVRDEQNSTDGAVSYSTTQINRLVFMGRAAIAKATGDHQ